MDDVEDKLFWEGDIEEVSSPLDVEHELHQFRRQWQEELEGNAINPQPGKTQSQGDVAAISVRQPTLEDQAKYLFIQGVNAEQAGRLYDAIKYYRRAVQLVPDIEFRIDDYKPRRFKQRQDSESSVGSTSSEVEVEDLLQHFTNLQANDNTLTCTPQTGSNGSGHISLLPVEILMYVFKWVVSPELDFLSLVRLSEVCRGFYVCARDEELWKLICQRVYGRNCGRPGSYRSYRNMYIEKAHVLLNGCYISRQEYFREGEKSLDGLYRPYHLVEWYRYIRFFPDGNILMLTSPENPHVEVRRLRHRNINVQGVLHGYYKVTGDQVTALLKRRKVVETQPYYYRHKVRQQNLNNEAEQSFRVEFTIKNTGRRSFSQLVWKYYAVHTMYKASGTEQIAEFELSHNKYPPLYFSRVKSYTAISESPLE